MFLNNTPVSVIDHGTTITVIDRVPPDGQGFYRLDARAPWGVHVWPVDHARCLSALEKWPAQ